jgi:tyrosine-protein phosphatase SIW14
MISIRAVNHRRAAYALIVLAYASTAAAKDHAASISPVRIENFGKIDDHYYRGAQPEGRDFTDLAALGIKTVIDLTSDDGVPQEPSLVEQAGMRFVKIPMTTRVAPTADELAAFLRVVNDPAAQPVYVHCVGGRHRTGVMTAVYRMTNDGWTGARAFEEMKQYKFGADFLHPEFKKFVLGFAIPSTPLVAATTSAPIAAGATTTTVH